MAGPPDPRVERVVSVAGGEIEVELLPDTGARLHRLRAFGHDLLRTPDDPSKHRADPFRFGAYVMAPWCNRIAPASTLVEGQLVDLPPTFEDGTAIHGQVHSARWWAGEDGTFSVAGGGDGWPWPYECRMRVAAHGTLLAIDLALANLSSSPMPAGIGLHPWFLRPLEVRIAAARAVASSLDPQSPSLPVNGALDRRRLGPMPLDLDAAWQELDDPAVELAWPDVGIAATMRVRADAEPWIVAASPSSLDAVAVEPQTHAPYGLARLLHGDRGAMQLLPAGAATHLAIELAFTRRRAGDAIGSA